MPKDKQREGPAPKSYAERIDPGGEFGKQTKGMAILAGQPFATILRLLGVEKETLAQAKELDATYKKLVSEPDRIAAALAPYGWIFHGLAHVEAYAAAATLVEEGKIEEAEELLVTTYNEDDHVFIRFYHRVWSLYQGDDTRREIALARQRLLDEAYELHKDGHYAGAISIVLAQIEGIFIDMTAKPVKYFYESNNPNVVDDVTLAGHPNGLKALAKLMSEGVRGTVVSDKLTRHGILHGRVLAYDTLRNSTKAWAALLAVIEAVGPRAAELNAKAAEKDEKRWAGSKEVDEYGERRDRRGFDQAKKTLFEVQQYQHDHYAQRGRYAVDRAALVQWQPRLAADDLELRTADDNHEYWAWVVTPTGVVFGLAGRGGEYASWVFFGEQPPAGGIDADERWTPLTEADYPDW